MPKSLTPGPLDALLTWGVLSHGIGLLGLGFAAHAPSPDLPWGQSKARGSGRGCHQESRGQGSDTTDTKPARPDGP